MITVNGRVRATVRLTANGVDGACVVASSWSSARVFPRTLASGVAFGLETAEGELYSVDPFEALVVVPVRRRVAHEDVRTEDGWIADGDEVQVEGELQPARGRAHPILRARRLSAPASGGTHRIPPRTLTRGESERIVAPPIAATPVAADVPAPPPAGSPEPTTSPAPAAPAETTETTETTETEQAPRRPKKKRPDSSGTPTPIQ
jgi:hypothetical protein